MKSKEEQIEEYAISLVHHGICECIEVAEIESARYHRKKLLGLEEPLKCPHSIDATEILYIGGGNINHTIKLYAVINTEGKFFKK